MNAFCDVLKARASSEQPSSRDRSLDIRSIKASAQKVINCLAEEQKDIAGRVDVLKPQFVEVMDLGRKLGDTQ